jgi:hypothetical protein
MTGHDDGSSPLLWLHRASTASIKRNTGMQDENSLLLTDSYTNDDDVSSHSHYSSVSYFRRLWESYYSLLEKRPLLVKSLTAFFILGGADLTAQGLEHWRQTSTHDTGVDWPRSARFGAFGLFGASFSHYYFYYLDSGMCLLRSTQNFVCLVFGFSNTYLSCLFRDAPARCIPFLSLRTNP